MDDICLKGTTGKRRRERKLKREMTNIIEGGRHGLAGGVVGEDASAQQGCAASAWNEVESVNSRQLFKVAPIL